MLEIFMPLIIISSALLALITSARIAFLMATRWSFGDEPTSVFVFLCAVAAAIVCGFGSYAAVQFGGLLPGFVFVFFSIPIVGAVWLFVVGANKALERMLNNLLKKMS